MTTRERVRELVDRVPEDTLEAFVPLLERLARPPTVAELKAAADANRPDPEPLSEAELEGEAEYQAWLAGQVAAIPHEELMQRGHPTPVRKAA